jgi:maleylacetoacetate isomerase
MMTSSTNKTGMILYNYALSSASYRLRIALNLKNITPAEIVDINLRAGDQNEEDYRNHVPGGLVPALDFGKGTYSQSVALIEWLDVTYPEPRLIPEDPILALAAREVALSIACDIHPLNNLRILKYLTGQLDVSDTSKNEWYLHWVREGFEGVEGLLSRQRNTGPFCLGANISVADVCLVPQVFNARRFKVDLTAFPQILSVFNHCQSLRAFQDAEPHLP